MNVYWYARIHGQSRYRVVDFQLKDSERDILRIYWDILRYIEILRCILRLITSTYFQSFSEVVAGPTLGTSVKVGLSGLSGPRTSPALTGPQARLSLCCGRIWGYCDRMSQIFSGFVAATSVFTIDGIIIFLVRLSGLNLEKPQIDESWDEKKGVFCFVQ